MRAMYKTSHKSSYSSIDFALNAEHINKRKAQFLLSSRKPVFYFAIHRVENCSIEESERNEIQSPPHHLILKSVRQVKVQLNALRLCKRENFQSTVSSMAKDSIMRSNWRRRFVIEQSETEWEQRTDGARKHKRSDKNAMVL